MLCYSDEEKKKLDIHDREAFRGYTALRGENVDPANRGDMHVSHENVSLHPKIEHRYRKDSISVLQSRALAKTLAKMRMSGQKL